MNDYRKKHEWTEEEEQVFKNWLIKFLLKTKGEEVARVPITNRYLAEKLARHIILNYGWKTKSQQSVGG
jgi:hypothetical protein